MPKTIAAILAASLLSAHAAELPDAVSDNPWIKIIPAGVFSGRDGRGPYNAGDRAALDQIVTVTRAYHGATDIVFDYEHQTMNAQKNGQPAPAAGWIKEVEARDDGLYGRVEWTAAAAAAIKAKEYRYLSPVFFHKPGGEILALQNVALTNAPNLNLTEVSAHSLFSAKPTTEAPMKQILAALGLSEGSSETDVLTAINSLLTSSTAIAVAAGLTKDAKSEEIAVAVQSIFADRKKIAIAAGQPETATTDQIVAAFASAQSAVVDPAKFVPIAQVEAMQAQFIELQKKSVEDTAETDVGQAIKDGKIIPALKDWAISLHKADKPAFDKFVGKAPVLVSAQAASAVAPSNLTAELDDAETAIMRQLGHSAEDMKKSKAQMEAKA